MSKKNPVFFFLSHLKNSLFSKLFLMLIALFVLCFFLTVILWNTNMAEITKNTSASHIYDIIQISNDRFEDQFKVISSYASVIQEMPETISTLKDGIESEQLDKILQNCVNSLSEYVNGVALLDMNGRFYFNGVSYIPQNYMNTDWFKKTVENPEYNTFSMKNLFGVQGSRQYISISRPIRHDNQTLGILMIDLKPDFFVKCFGTSRMDGNIRTIIVGDNNQIIYQNTSMISKELIEKIVSYSLEHIYNSHYLTEVEFDGNTYMVMAQKSTYTGWTNIAFCEKNIITENYKTPLIITVLYSVLFLIATVLLSIILFNILSKKMYRLTSGISKIDLENIDESPLEFMSDQNDEIGIISDKISSMLDKISMQVKEINYLNEEKRKREFKALRAQLNSHFLYNSLNVIVNLSKTQGANNIKSVAESLIKLLQYSTDPTPGLVTLADELSYIKNYILLMQHKFFNNIEIVYDIDESLLSCYTIKMLLQPVVENSIKYAFDDSEGYYILIKMQKLEDNRIEIRIVDNGKGIPKETLNKILKPEFTESGHLGLSNLEKRIKLTFGEEYGISLFSVLGMQTTVIIEIPYIDENNS